MTITFVNVAAAAHIGTTPVAPAFPTGPVAGRIMVMFVSNKAFSVTPTTPATWTQQTTGTSGSVATGGSIGSVRGTAYTHDVTGAETGTQSVTTTGATVATGRIGQYAKTLTNWLVTGTTLSDTTETGTAVSATGTQIPIAIGDMLVYWVAIKDDAPVLTSHALTVPGCTLGTATVQTKASTTLGDDGAGYWIHCTVTAGASSGAPTYTATSSVSGASAAAVPLVRLREALPAAKVPGPYLVRREAVRRSIRW